MYHYTPSEIGECLFSTFYFCFAMWFSAVYISFHPFSLVIFILVCILLFLFPFSRCQQLLFFIFCLLWNEITYNPSAKHEHKICIYSTTGTGIFFTLIRSSYIPFFQFGTSFLYDANVWIKWNWNRLCVRLAYVSV